MANQDNNYPLRTGRNTSIEKVKGVFEHGVEKSGEEFKIAGRIVGILDDGFVMQDESGRMDLVYDEEVGVGDIVECGVESEERVDNKGEKVMVFLAGSLKILAPCKDDFFIKKSDHNFKKMVIDRNLQEKLIIRGQIIDGIKKFFKDRGFLEVETPQLVRFPGMEPYLDVFKTQFIDQAGSQSDMFLITSPEYAMKKILISGQEKIFQICKSFRNKETDSKLHNPEFTLLEWYQAYASYIEIMKDTEEMVEALAKQINNEPKISFQGAGVDVSTPWPRVKVKDLFKDYSGIGYEDFEDVERLRVAVKGKGYKVDDKTSYEDLFFKIFMNEIEPKLGFDKPVIAYEYPASMAALSKKCSNDPKYAERFEVFIAGVELCNAFTELNDPEEQLVRLESEREDRLKMGKDDYPVDQSFISALKFGMPPSGGNALGVDRLVMLLTDTPDIRDIIYFPFRDL